MGKAMRWFRALSGLDALVILTGLLALFAMSPFGHGAAIIAMISVIGIPVYFLLALLPAVFLAVLAVRLAWGAINAFRGGSANAGMIFALALAVMAEFFVFRAWRVDWWLDGKANALAAGDKDELQDRRPIGTLAVLRNTRSSRDTENPCDDLCQRLLLTGAAKQVLALTSAPPMPPPRVRSRRGRRSQPYLTPPWPSLEPAAGMEGIAWRLEARGNCTEPAGLKSIRPLQIPRPPRQKGEKIVRPVKPVELIRLKLAGGTCLTGEAMTLEKADALLAYGTVSAGKSPYGAGFHAWADTVQADRIAFWRRGRGGLEEAYRRTRISWSRPPWIFVPVYLHGYQFAMKNGWMRGYRYRNRERYERTPLGEFLQDRLGLALEPDATTISASQVSVASGTKIQSELRAAQAAAADRVLQKQDSVSELDVKIVADYVSSIGSPFTRRGNGAGPEDGRRMLRITQDQRLDLPSQSVGAIGFAAEGQPDLASDFAAALFARLDGLGGKPSENWATGRWNTQLRLVTRSLAVLPAGALKNYRAGILELTRDRERRIFADTLLGRLDILGADVLPQIFAMMDDAFSLRDARDRQTRYLSRNWSAVWQAGLRSLCRLGPAASSHLPGLHDRVAALAAKKLRPSSDLAAAAMLRMGASEDDIRAALAIDAADAKAMRSFEFTVRRARREDACKY
ncbi:MAG: hypothetical protein AB7F96_15115 [Beijerinckiaceae bacterium]